jgi:hypothetical protein
MVFHVLNRGVARMQLFEKPADYQAFEHVLQETLDERPMRIMRLLPDAPTIGICCSGPKATATWRLLYSGSRSPMCGVGKSIATMWGWATFIRVDTSRSQSKTIRIFWPWPATSSAIRCGTHKRREPIKGVRNEWHCRPDWLPHAHGAIGAALEFCYFPGRRK